MVICHLGDLALEFTCSFNKYLILIFTVNLYVIVLCK